MLGRLGMMLGRGAGLPRSSLMVRWFTGPDYNEAQEHALLERPTLPVDSPLRRIDLSKLTITRTTVPKECPPVDKLVWGETFSDHMLEVCHRASLIFLFFLFFLSLSPFLSISQSIGVMVC
jgi:hypothetical protein